MRLSGDGNSAAVTQSGAWGNNASSLVETSSDNMVSVVQSAIADVGSTPQTLNNSQLQVEGASNLVTISQSVTPSGGNPGTNSSILHIAGNNGVVNVVQASGP